MAQNHQDNAAKTSASIYTNILIIFFGKGGIFHLAVFNKDVYQTHKHCSETTCPWLVVPLEY